MAIIESKSPTQPTIQDACAVCERPVWVRERAWLRMSSTWGLALASNLCADPACREIRDEVPEDVAARLRIRRRRQG